MSKVYMTKLCSALAKKGITYDDFRMFKKCEEEDMKEIPPRVNHCLCGHKIVRNFYVQKGGQVLILGSSCIRNFLPKRCTRCDAEIDYGKNRLCAKCKEKPRKRKPRTKK